MWSSWAWVITTASMRSYRPSRLVKSGRIRSTPGWSGSGNSTPQSTISRRPGVLEHRHVAADLTEAAEPDDAQAVPGQRGGRPSRDAGGSAAPAARRLRVLMPRSPAASRRLRPGRCAAARSGLAWRRRAAGRVIPPGSPSRRSAAFAMIAPWVRVMIPMMTGSTSRWMSRASATRPRAVRVDHLVQPVADHMADHADEPGRADRQPRQVEHVVAAVEHQVRGEPSPAEVAPKSPLASLTATIRGCCGQPDQGLGLDRHAGAAGDVVEHARQPGRVRDGGEVRDQAFLGRLVVVRRDDEQPVRARPFCLPGQLAACARCRWCRPRPRSWRGRPPPR